MEWVVKTVQEVVDTPLYLDTINAEAIEAGLKAYKSKKGKAVINSIMARPESMEVKFPLLKNTMRLGRPPLGPSGLPRDAEERGVLAAELIQKATEHGISGKMSGWIPSSPRSPAPESGPGPQLRGVYEMFKDLQDVLPG